MRTLHPHHWSPPPPPPLDPLDILIQPLWHTPVNKSADWYVAMRAIVQILERKLKTPVATMGTSVLVGESGPTVPPLTSVAAAPVASTPRPASAAVIVGLESVLHRRCGHGHAGLGSGWRPGSCHWGALGGGAECGAVKSPSHHVRHARAMLGRGEGLGGSPCCGGGGPGLNSSEHRPPLPKRHAPSAFVPPPPPIAVMRTFLAWESALVRVSGHRPQPQALYKRALQRISAATLPRQDQAIPSPQACLAMPPLGPLLAVVVEGTTDMSRRSPVP